MEKEREGGWCLRIGQSRQYPANVVMLESSSRYL